MRCRSHRLGTDGLQPLDRRLVDGGLVDGLEPLGRLGGWVHEDGRTVNPVSADPRAQHEVVLAAALELHLSQRRFAVVQAVFGLGVADHVTFRAPPEPVGRGVVEEKVLPFVVNQGDVGGEELPGLVVPDHRSQLARRLRLDPDPGGDVPGMDLDLGVDLRAVFLGPIPLDPLSPVGIAHVPWIHVAPIHEEMRARFQRVGALMVAVGVEGGVRRGL